MARGEEQEEKWVVTNLVPSCRVEVGESLRAARIRLPASRVE
jgi:hypothetical protein